MNSVHIKSIAALRVHDTTQAATPKSIAALRARDIRRFHEQREHRAASSARHHHKSIVTLRVHDNTRAATHDNKSIVALRDRNDSLLTLREHRAASSARHSARQFKSIAPLRVRALPTTSLHQEHRAAQSARRVIPYRSTLKGIALLRMRDEMTFVFKEHRAASECTPFSVHDHKSIAPLRVRDDMCPVQTRCVDVGQEHRAAPSARRRPTGVS